MIPVVTLLTEKLEDSGYETGREIIVPTASPALLTTPGTAEQVGRRQGSPYSPSPPTPFHNVLNLMHGQEKIRKNSFHFQD